MMKEMYAIDHKFDNVGQFKDTLLLNKINKS